MKRLILAIVIIAASLQLQAQYKKVGYFGKGGRTYQLGATAHFFGDGKGAPIGYHFGAGTDRLESHWIFWYEIEVLPPVKYKYQTTGTDYITQATVPVTVTGKSQTHLIFNYNVGYHFLDRREEEPMFQPFVYMGLNLVTFGRPESSDYGEVYDVKKTLSTESFRIGGRAGLGLTIKLSDLIQIKTLAGYNLHYDSEKPYSADFELYKIYTSQPFVSTGIQFRLSDKD